MKIPNKRELQQIAISHSSDINTKDFIEIYRKCTDKPYSFLVIDTTLQSNNLLRFRKNLNITNDDMIKLNMKSYNMISIEKQQKYLLYHQENSINMNILLVKIYCHLINSK